MAQSSTFYLILTDGDENHVPGTTRKGPEYERAEDHGLEQKALSLFAKEMMRQPGRVITKDFTCSNFPKGYTVWVRQREKDPERVDWHIFGHPRHKQFKSFAQFAKHINLLERFIHQPAAPGVCDCKVCLKHPLKAEDKICVDRAPPIIGNPSTNQNPPTSGEGDEMDEGEEGEGEGEGEEEGEGEGEEGEGEEGEEGEGEGEGGEGEEEEGEEEQGDEAKEQEQEESAV